MLTIMDSRPPRILPWRVSTVSRAWAVAAVVLAVTVALAPVEGFAQAGTNPEIQSLLSRIDRLQRDMNTLQRQVYRGNAPPSGEAPGGAVGSGSEPNLAAAMQIRLDEIETQMRVFTGRLEEANHAISELTKKVETLASDIDLRLKTLEGRGGGAPLPVGPGGATPPAANPAPAPGAPPGTLGTLTPRDLNAKPQTAVPAPGGAPAPQTASALPAGSVQEQYNYATSFLSKSDWAGAERALAAFISAHPKDPLTGNAQYWLGESHYVRGDFNSAAHAFAKGYKDYPKSAKGPDNLLKLGLSLANLKKTDSACTTFGRMTKDFPDASAAIKSRVAAERKKLRCR
ncbi:MAG: tol-pal system protein YbgF [Alphaproteobacteria bacterium]|nr:tol-pal system protein YbgF [Alphaproteobacteria bacterium]